MSDSRMIFDEVRCHDCKVVLPKDEAIKVDVCQNASIDEATAWFCEDCYENGQDDGNIPKDIYED